VLQWYYSAAISRLVGKTLSVFKQAENDLGALWYFIHHYTILLALQG
tara:strand:+ start:459 stop:599 length:141 start_codon:yes stop_codon:yes gene_type:complete